MVGHDDKGVELDAAFGALVLEYVHKEDGVLFDLEETATGGGDGCDEVSANLLWRDFHAKG